MSLIFVFGPAWNRLDMLLNTINHNMSILSNIKSMYISTNDINVYNYFKNINNINNITIKCTKFADNEGSQKACFNSIISGMKMIIEHEENNNEDDIVVYCHEDVYVKDLSLFNNAISKFKKGVDIVCRKYEGTKIGGTHDYFMNDGFFVKKNKVKEIYGNSEFMYLNHKWCEIEHTKIIQNYKICYIPYYDHSTHHDSELGFFHLLNYEIFIKFWDKSNIQEIYDL